MAASRPADRHFDAILLKSAAAILAAAMFVASLAGAAAVDVTSRAVLTYNSIVADSTHGHQR